MLPPAGGEYRAEQMTLLAGMMHRRRTDPRLGEWLNHTAGRKPDPHSDPGATIRELKRQYDRRVKLPQALVEELARTAVLGQQAWVDRPGQQRFRLVRAAAGKNVRTEARSRPPRSAIPECRLRCPARRLRTRRTDVARHQSAGGLREQLVPLVAAIARQRPRSRNVDILSRAAIPSTRKEIRQAKSPANAASISTAAGSM